MHFAKFLIPVILTTIFYGCQNQTDERPNVLLIMGDDIGFSDIGCYGSEIQTPNLDRLADQGIRFTQFYNMAKCETTRSSLLTGLYRGGVGAVSIGQALRSSGYHTIQSGKEHFSDWVPDYCRADSSFDNRFHFWASTEYFLPPDGEFRRPYFINGRKLETEDFESWDGLFYQTDAIADKAIEWLNEVLDSDRPFFLYLPFHAAHYPLQAHPEDIAKYRGRYLRGWDSVRADRFRRQKETGIIPENAELSPPSDNINQFRGHPDGDEWIREQIPLYRPWNSLTDSAKSALDLEMAVFAAMLDRMDQNIGRVLGYLEEAGKLENTVIMYLSDNGSCPYDSNRDFETQPGDPASYRTLSAAWANVGNTPFRYFKQYGHEGGGRTHLIVHWPKQIKKTFMTDQPGHIVDIFPTLLDVTNTVYPEEFHGRQTLPLHGRSLMPIIQGEQREEPDFFISGFTERFRMFRQGNWKIVKVNNGGWELYDLENDPTEINDLALAMTDKQEALIEAYQKAQAEYLKIEEE